VTVGMKCHGGRRIGERGIYSIKNTVITITIKITTNILITIVIISC
jgi:hypothetical protein